MVLASSYCPSSPRQTSAFDSSNWSNQGDWLPPTSPCNPLDFPTDCLLHWLDHRSALLLSPLCDGIAEKPTIKGVPPSHHKRSTWVFSETWFKSSKHFHSLTELLPNLESLDWNFPAYSVESIDWTRLFPCQEVLEPYMLVVNVRLYER